MSDDPEDLTQIEPNGAGVSRRTFLRKSLVGAAAVGGGALVAGARAIAASKVSKTVAQYQNHPNGGQKCRGCSHFSFFGSCEVVEGLVSSQGWCKFFKAA
jgi:hypothetical protein